MQQNQTSTSNYTINNKQHHQIVDDFAVLQIKFRNMAHISLEQDRPIL